MEKINHNGKTGYFLSEEEYQSLCDSFETLSTQVRSVANE